MVEAGLTVREAAFWANIGRGTPPAQLTALAVRWREMCSDAYVIEAWNRCGPMSPVFAHAWMAAGYTAGQFFFLRGHEGAHAWRLIRSDPHSDTSVWILDDWLSTDIPADWACRFVAAGIVDVAEACSVWSNQSDLDELGGALDLLAALLLPPEGIT